MIYKEQEFLDFSFNGHWLSDFGMVVVSNGDRLSLNAQPQFSNNTTTIEGKDGMLYWGTQKTNRVFDINVASDHMTSRQIEGFKGWLQPGIMGALIFSETPYRNCLALVNGQTVFSYLPFSTTTVKDGYTVEDTVFKGNATISFVTYDIYDYSRDPDVDYNYAFLDNITDAENFQPPIWWLQSGIPLQSALPSSGMVFLGNGYRGNNTTIELPDAASTISINASGNLSVFNAGTIKSQTNVMFNRVINIVRDVTSWNNITFAFGGKTAIIKQPRLLSDFKYTLNLLDGYDDTTFILNKVAIQKDLMENLDGALKRQIIGILRLTGDGLQWATLTNAKAVIIALIENQTLTFSLNGLKQQCVLQATMGLWSFGTDSAIYINNQLVEENFGDVFNNNYIEVAGNLNMDSFALETIGVTGGPISNIYINYKYSYA